jgi:hypothetical protein
MSYNGKNKETKKTIKIKSNQNIYYSETTLSCLDNYWDLFLVV